MVTNLRENRFGGVNMIFWQTQDTGQNTLAMLDTQVTMMMMMVATLMKTMTMITMRWVVSVDLVSNPLDDLCIDIWMS